MASSAPRRFPREESGLKPGARRPRPLLPILVVALMSLVVFAVLNPILVFRANTPSGGDMGAHVLAPALLRDYLLPHGHILGWSNDWFAGFPAFYFYFPLPSLVIVLLDVFLPYGVAFKLVAVAGLLGLPPASYFLARSMRFGRPVALAAAGAATAYTFFESWSIYGGNIASTLAGEFSYSWSFALGMVYLGLLIRSVRDDRRYMPWAAAALAATALSHILTTVVLVFASLTVLLWRRAWRVALPIWGWGFAIAGFWAVPLAARLHFSSDMAWSPLTAWKEVFPLELWLLLPLAIAGAVWAARRTPRGLPLVAATLLPLIYYPLPTTLPRLFPGTFSDGPWKLWNGRLLPYWYFGVAFFAAVGVGALGTAISRRFPERLNAWWARGVALLGGVVAVFLVWRSHVPLWAVWLTGFATVSVIFLSLLWQKPVTARSFVSVTLAAVLALGGLAGVTFVDGWARWNFSGYEGKAQWPEYQALMETMSQLPPGRIQWEANSKLDQYGTPMALMLFPYWDGPGYPSMEGLFFESSLTTPFHFINAGEMSYTPSNPIPGLRYHNFDFTRGIPHLEVYGVRYYVTFTKQATEKADGDPSLTKVATSPPFTIYELPPTSLVEVATHQPAVYQPKVGPDGNPPESFNQFALDWYDNLSDLDRWVAAGGPASWPRISTLADLPDQPIAAPQNAVSDVSVGEETISFHTTAVGVPHLIKVSYFPNWKATGAEGPWRVSPSLMVVVPTSQDVVLRFSNTWAENGGMVLTAIGLLGLVAWPFARRRFPLFERIESDEPVKSEEDA